MNADVPGLFGGGLITVVLTAFIVFVGCMVAMPTILLILRQFGLYVTVEERRCLVYVLFGRVRLVLTEPGLHFPIQMLGWRALLVNFMGDVTEIDLRLDQEYLRSQAVNSEEGAPMGIGVWYEMWISDPVAYLFKNADPRGSLRTNVGNATVRNLSNMKLSDMLEERHTMSNLVREEVSEKSKDWGYSLGSVYIRKVHFRDENMIQQIQEKVVNRLRQVTSAIRQDGNQPGEPDRKYGGTAGGGGSSRKRRRCARASWAMRWSRSRRTRKWPRSCSRSLRTRRCSRAR